MRTRRDFLKAAGIGAAAMAMPGAAFAAPAASAASATKKPNILFIMSDDHCSQAVGAYGGRLARLNPTPVIDTLAKEGILMENAFVTNSICTPSRACIITGQHSIVNGVLDLGGRIPPQRPYPATQMRKARHDTRIVGQRPLK